MRGFAGLTFSGSTSRTRIGFTFFLNLIIYACKAENMVCTASVTLHAELVSLMQGLIEVFGHQPYRTPTNEEN